MTQAEKRLQVVMNVEQAKIFLWSKEDDQLVRYLKDGGQERFPSNSGLAGYVLAQGEYENVTNNYNHVLFNGNIDIDTKLPVIVWPIKHPTERRKKLGVFEVVNVRGIQGMAHTAKAKLNIFDYESLDFFSRQLAQAIVNNQKSQQNDSEIFSYQDTVKQSNLSLPNKTSGLVQESEIGSNQDLGTNSENKHQIKETGNTFQDPIDQKQNL